MTEPLTPEWVRALPEHTVVIDRDGDVWQKRGSLWCGYEAGRVSDSDLARWAPLTTLVPSRTAETAEGIAVPTLEGFRSALEWLAQREGVRADWYSEDAVYLHAAFYGGPVPPTPETEENDHG